MKGAKTPAIATESWPWFPGCAPWNPTRNCWRCSARSTPSSVKRSNATMTAPSRKRNWRPLAWCSNCSITPSSRGARHCKRAPSTGWRRGGRPQPHVSTMTPPCETCHCDWRRPRVAGVWISTFRLRVSVCRCVYRKLNPNVVMMKSAQDGVRNYGAGSLNRTRDRRILLQRPMRSNAVVIGCIVFQNSAQMCLAQNDDVIQTLAPDRSDQPLGKAILPRRSWCDRLVPNAHGAQSACDDGTIDAIPVPDHVARSLIPGKCFCYLACYPMLCRVGCHVDPDDISAIKPYNDEAIKQLEADGWDNEQIHGGNVRRVITQEGLPSLAGRPPPLDHVLGNA